MIYQNAPTDNPAVYVDRVSKSFGEFTALDDVSLKIAKGEFICFLGPSGCGKTTLLRLLAGLESVSSGAVSLGGHDVTRLSALKRDIGIVFQSYALFPNLTVLGNVAYGLKNVTSSARRNRVEELLALVKLEGIEQKYPHQLSGGQQQRVAIARALAISPQLLLLDEPLSALDAHVRHHLRLQLKELHRRLKLTTIMVTHDQEEALVLADRIVVMNAGRIEQIGTPDEIYFGPKSAFVANFVGTMNTVRGTISENGFISIPDTSIKLPKQVSMTRGSPVDVCFRPEDARLVSDFRDDEASLSGSITEAEFFGATERLHIKISGLEKPVLVDCGSRSRDVRATQRGAQIKLSIPCDRISIIPIAPIE
jgi:iron(III) transport system ATP-binding protein